MTFPQGRFDGTCYVYNEETVVRVHPITITERIEFLLIKKRYSLDIIFSYRFEEAIILTKTSDLFMTDLGFKVKNGHLEHLLKAKDYD